MGTIKELTAMLSPGSNAFVITPGVNYIPKTRGLYVGVSGDVNVEMAGGNIVLLVNLAGGIVHPLQVIRVFATNTDATNIIGIL